MRGLKIFSLAFFSYLLLSLYANYFDSHLRDLIYSRGFEPSMVVMGVLFALIFFGFFAAGYLLKTPLPSWFLAPLLLFLSFYDPPLAPVLAFLLLLAYRLRLDPFRRFPEVAMGLAVVVPVMLYAYEGIPFFDRSLRYELVGPLVLLTLLAAVGMSYSRLSIRWKTLLLGIYTVIFFLGTFRSLLLLIYLSYFFSVYLKDGSMGVRAAIVGFVLSLSVLWMSGGVEALFLRVGFTFLVFHNLVRLSLPWGLFHGALLLSNNPRHMVSMLFGAGTNYTYFFFGQAVADFGILGVFEAFFLGALLRNGEESPETLGFLLSLMIYSLDSGVDALVLIFMTGAVLFEALYRK